MQVLYFSAFFAFAVLSYDLRDVPFGVKPVILSLHLMFYFFSVFSYH